jgi:uncharacterized protein (TIGR03118 family)
MKSFSSLAMVSMAASIVSLVSCSKQEIKALRDFNQVNLVANNALYQPLHVDSLLKNAWGVAWAPSGIAWVSSQGGHVSGVYDKDGASVRPDVNIPSPGGPIGGNPTGQVFNGSADFVLSNGQPARFIFVGVDGILSGWNGAAGTNALLIKNNVATASYTGLAIASNGGANMLYAADFRGRKIQVWDRTFAPVDMSFIDPNLAAGYAPFNIQTVGDKLYVLYAKVGNDGRDQAGAGLGFVSVFNTNGSFVRRFASRGYLNAPWGITLAKASFFQEKNEVEPNDDHSDGHDGKAVVIDSNQTIILVGNFGDGRITAFSMEGETLGQVKMHSKPLTIPGLWYIGFAPATATVIDPNRLYFAAGPNDEKDGLFGYIIKR